MFDSYHQPVDRDYTPAIALLTTAIIFVPALVLFSQPASYLPAIGVSTLCVILALVHSRNNQSPAVAPTALAATAKRSKDAK